MKWEETKSMDIMAESSLLSCKHKISWKKISENDREDTGRWVVASKVSRQGPKCVTWHYSILGGTWKDSIQKELQNEQWKGENGFADLQWITALSHCTSGLLDT